MRDVDAGDRNVEGGREDSPYARRTEIPPHPRSATNHCNALNRHGQPCKARAVTKDENGRALCAMHGGLSDPIKMGRGGNGKSRVTALRREVREDESIRAQAADVIKRGLAGDTSVSKTMLDAARSVFSFRAAQPPAEQLGHDGHPARPLTRSGRPITSLGDVLACAVERGLAKDLGLEDQILAAADEIRRRRGNEAA